MPGKRLNTTGWVDRYVNGMAGASKAYQDGIDRVVDNPMAKAADAIDSGRALSGYQQAQTRMAARLRAKSPADWKQAAKAVGAQRLATGAAAARPKLNAYVQSSSGAIQQLMDSVGTMPNTNTAEAVAKVAAWINGMKQIAGKQ